jgi:hypothetical protein
MYTFLFPMVLSLLRFGIAIFSNVCGINEKIEMKRHLIFKNTRQYFHFTRLFSKILNIRGFFICWIHSYNVKESIPVQRISGNFTKKFLVIFGKGKNKGGITGTNNIGFQYPHTYRWYYPTSQLWIDWIF